MCYIFASKYFLSTLPPAIPARSISNLHHHQKTSAVNQQPSLPPFGQHYRHAHTHKYAHTYTCMHIYTCQRNTNNNDSGHSYVPPYANTLLAAYCVIVPCNANTNTNVDGTTLWLLSFHFVLLVALPFGSGGRW